MRTYIKKVYLAGPDVFFRDNTGQVKKDLCTQFGLSPLFPLDNEITREDPAPEIFKANLRMMDHCDAVLANVTPFRGPSCDPGTAFEIGYALRSGIPVFCYSSDSRELIQRIEEDFPQCLKDGMSIEDFGNLDNLMISCADRTINVDNREDIAAFDAFKSSLNRISEINSNAVNKSDPQEKPLKFFENLLNALHIAFYPCLVVLIFNWNSFMGSFGLNETAFMLELVGFSLALMGLRYPKLLEYVESRIKLKTSVKPSTSVVPHGVNMDNLLFHFIIAWCCGFVFFGIGPASEALLLAEHDNAAAQAIVESVSFWLVAGQACGIGILWLIMYVIGKFQTHFFDWVLNISSYLFAKVSASIAHDSKVITGAGFFIALTGLCLDGYQLFES